MTKITIAGKTVTNKHTDALENLLGVYSKEKVYQATAKKKLHWTFCIDGHEFKTRRELANHLLSVVNNIPCDTTKLKHVKSNGCPAFEFN